MKVHVDRALCTGHGRCYAVAPTTFQPDDDGYCVIPEEDVPDEAAADARLGAANCPEDAITVVDGDG